MIFYATKKTVETYKFQTIDQMSEETRRFAKSLIGNEYGDPVFEWGCKIFYFDRRKCLQFVNFKTRFTVFIFDLKVADVKEIPNMLAQYLLALYNDDPKMQKALERYFEASPFVCFDKISNRSIISKLNHNFSQLACDGYRFYDYIKNGVLHTMAINKDFNECPFSTKESGKEEWYFPREYFAKTIKDRFGRD